MLFLKKQGFTLIELMVVIVIIGVLASLAIPRFTEASAKAKVAEAPRVIASYESAYLALVAEQGTISNLDNLIFDTTAVNKESKWWKYSTANAGKKYTAKAGSQMGKVKQDDALNTQYSDTTNAFTHSADPDQGGALKKYVPNFFRDSTTT